MAALPETQSVELELQDGWLTVWFNQPERRNPLTDDVVSDLAQVFAAVREVRTVRGVTLRGRGGFFCAGGDLKSFNAIASGAREQALRTSTTIGDLLAALNALPQVTVAAIEGAAMAGGLGVACCCDVTIGLKDARFAFSETRIGITPAQIARYVLQKCGYAVGRRLMLTAARFKGEEAQQLGVLDFCVDSVDALEAAERRIRSDVLGCAPGAVAACKSLIIGLPQIPEDMTVSFAAENFSRCLQGDEGKEGVAAFLEKRQPNWHVEVSS